MNKYRLASGWRIFWKVIAGAAVAAIVALTWISIKRAGAHNYNGIEAFMTAVVLATMTALLSVAATLLNWKIDNTTVSECARSALNDLYIAERCLHVTRSGLRLLLQDSGAPPSQRSIHIYHVDKSCQSVLDSLATATQGIGRLLDEEEIARDEQERTRLHDLIYQRAEEGPESTTEIEALRKSGLDSQAVSITRLMEDFDSLKQEPIIIGRTRPV